MISFSFDFSHTDYSWHAGETGTGLSSVEVLDQIFWEAVRQAPAGPKLCGGLQWILRVLCPESFYLPRKLNDIGAGPCFKNLHCASSCITLRPEGGRCLSRWWPKSAVDWRRSSVWRGTRRRRTRSTREVAAARKRKPHLNTGCDEGALLGPTGLNTCQNVPSKQWWEQGGTSLVLLHVYIHNFDHLIILVWLNDIHRAVSGN